MRNKGWLAALLVLCLLLAGCGNSGANTASEADRDSQAQTQTEAAKDSSTSDEGKEKDSSSAEAPSGSNTSAETTSDTAQAENGYPVFDFSSRTVTMNSGYEMPILGLGMFSLSDSQPSNDVDAYQAMERAVEAGKLRSIGLSNYYEPEDFDRVVNATTIRPALLQNGTHPYHQSGEMKEHIAQYGTVLESWFPLGGRGNTQTLFNDETISSIAAAHGVSSAQVIIRWHLQAGNICIPGSSNEQHIIEDYDVWDFELTEEEMLQMTALERDDRFADY